MAYRDESTGQLQQLVAFLVHKQFTVDALETLSTETPDAVRTVGAECLLQIHRVKQFVGG